MCFFIKCFHLIIRFYITTKDLNLNEDSVYFILEIKKCLFQREISETRQVKIKCFNTKRFA